MDYQLDHIHLTTANIDDWVDFYSSAMGGKVTSSVESFGARMVNLDLGGAPIRISSMTGVERQLSQQTGQDAVPVEGYHHMGFLVSDVDACIDDLVSKGAEVEVPAANASASLRCGFVKLPGGVRVELCQRLQ